MCGILGFIGRSQNPRASFELAHALFIKTEQRGEHASGFWACEAGDVASGASIFFDKEAVKSTVYVNRPIWSKDFAKANADLLIAHCRFSSANVGNEKVNKNNHPHVTEDYNLALVHNGRVPEYHALKSRYDLRSDCDSEILLRIVESKDDSKTKEELIKKELPKVTLPTPNFAARLIGIKDIFARVNHGAMAVAIGERGLDGSRSMWLFRDKERPLHAVDMRKTLGQIVFCSTPEIWRAAVEICPIIKPFTADNQPIIEFPEDQIWLLSFDAEGKWLTRKFKVTKNKYYDWDKSEEEESKCRHKEQHQAPQIIGRLDSDEDVVEASKSQLVGGSSKKKGSVSVVVTTPTTTETGKTTSVAEASTEPESDLWEDPEFITEKSMAEFKKIITDSKTMLESIEAKVQTLAKENGLPPKEFDMVISSLQDAYNELQATLIVLSPKP